MKPIHEMSKSERRELMGNKPYMLIAAMRTGRTTRMMTEAINLATKGRAVYVVCGTMDHAKSLEREWEDDIFGLGIKFETAESLGPTWSWEAMRPARCHPNCEFLVDTWAIEKRFERMLDMLHRWDPD